MKTFEKSEVMGKLESLYSSIVSAARAVIANKMADDIKEPDDVIIPFDKSKIDLHFEDPESGQSGEVAAFKMIAIPYTLFHSVSSVSEDQFLTKINMIFLNPLMTAISTAFDELKDDHYKLYAKFGQNKDGEFVVYIIFDGEIAAESAIAYEMNLASVFFDDTEIIDDMPEHFAMEGMNITVKLPEHGYGNIQQFIKAITKNDDIKNHIITEVENLKDPKFGAKVFTSEDEFFSEKYLKYNNRGGKKIMQLMKAAHAGLYKDRLALFMYNNILCFAVEHDKGVSTHPEILIPFHTDKEKVINIWRFVSTGIMAKIKLEGSEDAVENDLEKQTGTSSLTVIQDDKSKASVSNESVSDETIDLANEEIAISIEGAFLKVSIPDGLKTPDDMVKILKKANLDKTAKLRLNELIASGYEAIPLSKYAAMKNSGIIFDQEFKNDMYISYHNKKPDLKETREFIYRDFGGTTTVIGLYNSISADPNAKLPFGLAGGVRKANKGYRLKKVWIAVFNPRTNRVVHKPIAKSSKWFGVRVESTEIALEKSFGLSTLLHGNDLGFSSDPTKIQPNKHTFFISPKTGQIFLRFCFPISSDWKQFVAPIQSRGIDANIRNIFYDFQKVSQDWDLFSPRDIDGPNGKKAIDKIESVFTGYKLPNAYIHNQTGETGDAYIIFIPFWWVYNSLCIATLFTIRPSNAEDSDFCSMWLTDIYMVMYNSATYETAFPLLASDGVLKQTRLNLPSNDKVSFVPGMIPSSKVIKASDITPVNTSMIVSERKINNQFRSGLPILPLKGALSMDIKTAITPNRDVTKPINLSTVSENAVSDLKFACEKLHNVLSHEGFTLNTVKHFSPHNDNIILGENVHKIQSPAKSAFSVSREDNVISELTRVTLQKACDIIAEESAYIKELKIVTSSKGETTFVAKL